MLSIDQLCQDNVAKYYAAILKENAAVTLQAGGFGVAGVETPQRKLISYNVFRRDEFERMYNDTLVSDSLKLRVLQETQPRERSFQLERIEGWHVIRTEKALKGKTLRDFLSTLERTFDSPFYSKSKGGITTIRDCLVKEEIYNFGPKRPVSAKSRARASEKDESVSDSDVGDVYKVFIEVKDSLGRHCQQLFDLGRSYGAVANPLLTLPELAQGETKADYYVIGRNSADIKARAAALGKALEELDFVKSVHVQNFSRRN